MSNVALAQTAAGTVVATALAWPANATYVQVSTSTITNNGIQLPVVGVEGTSLSVRNDGVNPLAVYPPTGASIGALAANAAYKVGLNQTASFVGSSVGGNYIALPAAAAPATPATITGTRVISLTEAGSTFLVSAANAQTVSLPAPAASNVGVTYTFIAAAAGAAILLIDSSGAGLMTGVWISAAGADLAHAINLAAPNRFIGFTATSAVGDRVTVTSTGAAWACFGVTSTQAGLAFS